MPSLREFNILIKRTEICVQPASVLRIYKLVRFMLGSQEKYEPNIEITIDTADGVETILWTPKQIVDHIESILDPAFVIFDMDMEISIKTADGVETIFRAPEQNED